jgi:hypothetical protein
VIDGFATVKDGEGEEDEVALLAVADDVSEDEESWHAANAANTAHPRAQLKTRRTLADNGALRTLLVRMSRPVKVHSDPRLGVRPTEFITYLPHNLRWQ